MMTDKELLKQFKAQPSAANLQPFIKSYAGLVYDAAIRQLGDEAAATRVTLAAFQALAQRARKLPRNTVVVDWLFRATRLGTKTENRARKRQPPKAPGRAAPPTEISVYVLALVDNALDRLPAKYRDPILLRVLSQRSWEQTAYELRTTERKVQKRTTKGLEKLARRFRKQQVSGKYLADLLGTPPSIPSETLLAAIGTAVEQALSQRPKEELVRAIFRGLAWIRWRRRLRILIRTAGFTLVLLAAAGFLFAHLVQTGQLTAWFIERMARNLAKEVPEAALPAKPWAGNSSQPILNASNLTQSAELYRTTNVWRANLRFSLEEWKKIEPKRILPVRNMQKADGSITLRNPIARRNGLAGVLGYEFEWVRGDLGFGGIDFPLVAARFKGNGTYIGSLYGQKRSFKVDLNKYSKGQALAGVHTLNFLNMIEDSSCMHDALSYEVFRESGVPSPGTSYAWLTVDIPGKWSQQPLGLYLMVENLDGDFAAGHFGSKKAPIFKPVTYELFKDLGYDWSAYAGIYDLKTKATEEQKRRVIDFARLLTHADDAEFARRVGEFLDLDEFARFVAGMVLLASYDGFLSNGQNFYMYLDPRSNKFGFMPWDLDHSWGEFGYIGTAEKRENASIWKPWAHPNRLLERVIVVDEFKQLYRAQLETMLATTFAPERLFRRIDEMRLIVRSPTEAESTFRLKRQDQATSTNWLAGPRDGEPTGPRRPVHQLKRFITNRVKSVRDQLDGKSEGTRLSLRDHH